MVGVVDPASFKNALGKMPTGVTVISTATEGELFGFTSNSFTSVSLLPPLVSFCLNKTAGSVNAFRSSNNFAVSILAANQASLSTHFSTSQPKKFASVLYQLGSNSNCPLLEGAVCWIECKKTLEYDGGDHLIFIGEVTNSIINNDLNPLIYFAKNYRELK